MVSLFIQLLSLIHLISIEDILPNWCDSKENSQNIPPYRCTLQGYRTYKRTRSKWLSKPFYSGESGYKLQLCVDPDGIKDGRGEYLSLGVYLQQGPNDEELNWPFKAKITIRILNWLNNQGHVEKTINHSEAPIGWRAKVKGAERAPGSWGDFKFVAHTTIEKYCMDTEYISNDNICFEILKVEIVKK